MHRIRIRSNFWIVHPFVPFRIVLNSGQGYGMWWTHIWWRCGAICRFPMFICALWSDRYSILCRLNQISSVGCDAAGGVNYPNQITLGLLGSAVLKLATASNWVSQPLLIRDFV